MIRFRKGGPDLARFGGLAQDSASGSSGRAHSAAAVTAALEWWMIPDKYRRRDIDSLECNIINVRQCITKSFSQLHLHFRELLA